MRLRLLWGCDPSRQFEHSWISFLLGSSIVQTSEYWHDSHSLPSCNSVDATVLVESGLLHLERNVSSDRIHNLLSQRQQRLNLLQSQSKIIIFHLSDEEGNDGDVFYPLIPTGTVIWRNFYHRRFSLLPLQISSFPIGPRKVFLDRLYEITPNFLMEPCRFPWAFMGTLWPSSSRQYAVSLFLKSLPDGCYYGGRRFGQGVPLDQYRFNLLSSSFALAPEGDRHLDTFRLWEVLCCGSIPLIVDLDNTAQFLLPTNYPCPIFSSWKSALIYASTMLSSPSSIIETKTLLFNWLQSSFFNLKMEMLKSISKA